MESEIDVEELKRVTNAIFDHISKMEIRKVAIEKDANYYWEVPSGYLHKVRDTQPQLDIGCLSDDLEFLSSILKDEKQAVSLMFIHLAPLLRYVGEKIGR